MKQVKLISAPITTRYWTKGDIVSLDTQNNKIRMGGCWFDFDDRFETEDMKTPEDYLQEVQEAHHARHDKLGYVFDKSTFRLSYGKKYIKVIENSLGSDRVHCFLDFDGNIYKAESWQRPAKGIRGHIDDEKKPLLGYDYYR